MSIILTVSNISKQYRLGLVGTGTLSHDLNRWWSRIRGKEDPYLKVGAVNNRSAKATEDYVWALKNIDFSVQTGEVLGIIGKNGAGKSTLLKILSRVTGPTTGVIKSRGRIASLLEVGTGFHPELTGKENIFLNGAILGMTKVEIKSKIDEIISFSGCEMFIDTPVKRYSSGMRVRLAFAVAAHLEPDILIIDEVLAVGDAEFQKKAIGKMQDISKTDGRTVLFVSHNMAAVQKLCTRAMLLVDGEKVFEGSTLETINRYRQTVSQEMSHFDFKKRNIPNKSIYFTKFEIFDSNENLTDKVAIDEAFYFKVALKSSINPNITLRIVLFDANETRIVAFDSRDTNTTFNIKEGKNCILCKLPDGLEIKPNNYYINISIRQGEDLYDHIQKVATIIVEPSDYFNSGKLITKDIPLVLKRNKWDFQ
ncbi:MAG: ABC transporter ATP-binding protein [Patiriisocius sp.]|uniref:ABC transporter ATP-binding protein n=1 Tax=Patiriisocius sp. TaxID=2822396 RepID=UPI003EF5EEF2